MLKLSIFVFFLVTGYMDQCFSFEWKKLTVKEVQDFNRKVYLNVHKDPPKSLAAPRGYLPFSEDLQESGYVIFSDHTEFESRKTKENILKKLPHSIIPIIIMTSSDTKTEIKKWKKINPNTVFISSLYRIDNFFWSRDALPIPLFNGVDLKVVESKYFYKKNVLEVDFINMNTLYNPFYFEGGNLIAHTNGECFTISNDISDIIPDFIYKNIYNCAHITSLPKMNGIGHIDERVRFLSTTEAITDTPEYLVPLKNRGFKVSLLPSYNKTKASYLNFIKINKTILLPTYRSSKDKVITKFFKNRGFKVIPIDSYELSKGRGSIHCITQTYPKVSLDILIKSLNAKKLEDEYFVDEYITYNYNN